MIKSKLNGLSAGERLKINNLLAKPVKFIDNPEFYKPGAAEEIFKDSIDLTDAELAWHRMLVGQRRIVEPEGEPDTKMTLISKEEKILFLQYNFARYKVSGLQESLAKGIKTQDGRELLLWWDIAQKLRSDLLIANLGLVSNRLKAFSLTKHRRSDEFADISRSIILNAIDHFNIDLGWKFSTYACNSINRGLSRKLKDLSKREKVVFCPQGADGSFGVDGEWGRADVNRYVEDVRHKDSIDELRFVLDNNLAFLDDKERFVINKRFTDRLTLQQVGELLQLTKERVRQVETKALAKLRTHYTNRDGYEFSSN